MGADARQGPRLLHRVGPRPADVGAPRLPQPARARHPLGVRAGPGARGRRTSTSPKMTDDRQGREAVRVRRGEGAVLPAAQKWGGRPSRSRRCRSRCSVEESMKHIVTPVDFEVKVFVTEDEARRQADRDELGRAGPAVGVDHGRLPERTAARGRGPRPHRRLRGHRRRRRVRQGHDLRGQAQHPDEPAALRRRADRPSGPGHAVPEGHRRRRQGGRAAGAVPRLEHRATRTPGRATCTTASTTGSTARSATPGSAARSAASGYNFRQGFYRFKVEAQPRARRLRRSEGHQARIPPQHEQQHLGAVLQRGGRAVRQHRERLPDRPHADPEPLLREGEGADADGAAEHRAGQPLRADHRQGAAGGLARRVHRGVEHRDLHRPHLPARVLEPHRVHLRADRPPDRDDDAAARRARATRARYGWNLVPSDDEWCAPIDAQVGPGRARVGDRLVQLHRAAQPDARGLHRPARATPTRPTLRDKTHGRIYDRDDDKAGEDEDETRSNSIDEKNAEFMNNESLSDTRLDE